jgi:glycosyltransferase involved in cell wall biosynthesis
MVGSNLVDGLDPELSIVIPCKNEQKYIGRLFRSLATQSYDLSKTKIIVADADSTDATLEVVNFWKQYFQIQIVKGGFPSTGRNNGAKLATSKYILFVDADVELVDHNLIENCLFLAKQRSLECVTAFVKPLQKDLRDMIFWQVYNLGHQFDWLTGPSAIGMFVLFERNRFWGLGGFDERILVGEDKFLTNQVSWKKFGVAPGYFATSNRRFKRMGYLRTILFYTQTTLAGKNRKFFEKDHSFYWR